MIHVLLVDDSEADNHLHQIVLHEAGIARRLSVAEHGAAALDLLSALSDERGEGRGDFPDLILLDINMPVMDGWEFLERFEERYAEPTVVVGMLSTSQSQRDIERAKRFKIVSMYTPKPLTLDDVRGIVARHFPRLSA